MENDSTQAILLQQEAGIVQVTMNRPKALNALSYEMIGTYKALLPQWQKNPDIKTVIIKGASPRTFCAGGDIKSAYQIGKAYKEGGVTLTEAAAFFRNEYRLNRALFHASISLVALMNGIVMGGGYGIAGPCKYRVCSEHTVFAMPETGIGFFPDIGGVYYLAQAPGQIGAYLAMSGDRINAADMIYCGLATHYIVTGRQGDFIDALHRGEKVEEALRVYSSDPEEPSLLEEKRALIDRCFVHKTTESIVQALQEEDDEWAQEKARLLLSRAPTSVKVALKHYRMAVTEDFDTVIARDFVLAQNFLKQSDFYEGVRCVLIDKGDVPVWVPGTLGEVTETLLNTYFLNAEQGLDQEVLA